MSNPPACPTCGTENPWTPHGAIVQEHRWHECRTCHAMVLIRLSDQVIVREGKA